MNVGDRVYWQAPTGGAVPGVNHGAEVDGQALVAIAGRRGAQPVLMRVPLSELSVRRVPCAGLGEEMRLEHMGFTLTLVERSNPSETEHYALFYGAVDGWVTGAAETNPDAAFRKALERLECGDVVMELRRATVVLGQRIAAGEFGDAGGHEAAGDLARMEQLLRKVLSAYPSQEHHGDPGGSQLLGRGANGLDDECRPELAVQRGG